MTPRKLDYSDQGAGYGVERTNPFDEPPTGTNPFGDEPTTREMKGNKTHSLLGSLFETRLVIRFSI